MLIKFLIHTSFIKRKPYPLLMATLPISHINWKKKNSKQSYVDTKW